MKKSLSMLVAVLFILPACGGIELPDSDGDGIPDIIDPCPNDPNPLCGIEPEPGAEYDCENPPTYTGYIPSLSPVLGDQFIVVLKPHAAGTSVESVMNSVSSRIPILAGLDALTSVGGFAGKLDVRTVARLLDDSSVAYVQQVGEKHTTELWNLDRIDQRAKQGDDRYDPFSDGAGVNIAIVDTGVTDHHDFEGRLQEPCFTAHTFGGCTDRHGHGTHVAGTSASKTYGVAKAANLYAVRVLNENGSGSDTDVIQGIEWVIEKKGELGGEWIINMSLGGSPAPALDAAVCKAIEAGVTNVVAAGNDTDDAYNHSPARVKQAITVGASQNGDSTAYFSNRGPGVDLYAPGVGILSTKPGGGTDTMQGTSMASPHVAGAAALFAEGKTPAEIEAAIVESATPDALSNVPSETANLLLYVGKETE